MLIVMEHEATDDQIQGVVDAILKKGFTARPIPGGNRVAIGVLYNKGAVEESHFLSLSGVMDVIRVTRPYKLVSRETKPTDTIVKVGDTLIGGGRLAVIAGPCSIESSEQALTIARHVKKAGAVLFRGGAFKPRTSPYSFQGLGLEGLKILARVREEVGLPVVTEAMDVETFDMVEKFADVVQIGARNMQNFSLLRRAGLSCRPVLLKRGISSTLEELFMAAEYIMEGGNEQLILCERGVRTFARHNRNTLDISSIPVIHKESHLPVIVDPSHASGRRSLVAPLTLAGVAAGAQGIMVEVHHKPEQSLSDGAQSLYPEQFERLMEQVRAVHRAVKNHPQVAGEGFKC